MIFPTIHFQGRCLLLCLSVLAVLACSKNGDDNPEPAKPTLSIADISQPEGNANNALQLTVRLSAPATANVLVNYSTLDGTAAAGADYVAVANADLLFTAGQTEKTISITVVGDNIKEADEYFELLLLNPVNATLAQARAKVTLLNDDSDNQLIIPATGYNTPLSYPGRSLVWQDEFDGNSLDANFWTHETGTGQGGWGNNELQHYRPENTYFQSGKLIIEARQENFGGSNYTSSRLITKGKKEFQYGRIDIRAALPEGQGLWPALWMLGSDFSQVGWPACGEIDIMEIIGSQPGRVHGTVHYGASPATHQQNGGSRALSGGAKFSEAFHVFSLEWEPNRLRWYLDDVQFHEATPATLGNGQPWPFNQPFFFIFNVAVGGNWPGSPDASTQFPQRMIVDYVRVFQ
ncbi:MAG: family 16 glycosylhydrolase [Saprospiraceae bacterium]|nr:family 16 glycosylhydrolase [Saprospiraceae bacterium]